MRPAISPSSRSRTRPRFVARYKGTDSKKKPLMVIGHMDVVEAKREDWERDPFTPVLENGYVFGRGSVDNKFEVSMIVATMAKLKRDGWKPKRDVILAFSGDEETQMVSTRKLAEQFKDAELALNGDAGGGLLSEEGKPVVYGIQAGEKTYADFKLTVTNPGGHSSRPGKVECHQSAGGRAGSHRQVSVPGHAQRADAGVLPREPAEVVRTDGRRHQALSGEPRGRAGHRDVVG